MGWGYEQGPGTEPRAGKGQNSFFCWPTTTPATIDGLLPAIVPTQRTYRLVRSNRSVWTPAALATVNAPPLTAVQVLSSSDSLHREARPVGVGEVDRGAGVGLGEGRRRERGRDDGGVRDVVDVGRHVSLPVLDSIVVGTA